jgi:hypothetical protein
MTRVFADIPNSVRWWAPGLLRFERLSAKSQSNTRALTRPISCLWCRFRYVNVLIGILSEEQAGKGLNLKDLEKLSKMVRFIL